MCKVLKHLTPAQLFKLVISTDVSRAMLGGGSRTLSASASAQGRADGFHRRPARNLCEQEREGTHPYPLPVHEMRTLFNRNTSNASQGAI